MPKVTNKSRSPDDLVNLNIRIHADVRRKLRIRAAETDRNVEDIVREILYPALGSRRPVIEAAPTP